MLSLIGTVLIVATLYDLVVVRNAFSPKQATEMVINSVNEASYERLPNTGSGENSVLEETDRDDVTTYAEGHKGI